MSRLLCCLRARRGDMGAALSHAQEGEACDGAGLPEAPPTMADVIRERKKKAGGAGLGTLRRRIAAAARRPRDSRPDRGCEHARFIRSVVSSWRLAEVFLLCSELEAGAALRDLATQAELAREPAAQLHADLARAQHERWWCDVELAGNGFSVCAHRAVLAARCTYFRDLLQRYPPSVPVVPLDGACASLSRAELEACVCALYAPHSPAAHAQHAHKWQPPGSADSGLDIINGDGAYSYRSSSLCRCDTRSRPRSRSRSDSAAVSRLAAVLGFSPDALHQDMRYLLESGEMSDCRLSWGSYSLPAHRLVLAARSRYFRSVMSRRGAGGGGVLVCVDEKVLPRRFAPALLHAAYTDQVDLSLIGRNSSSPSSTNSTSSSGTAWAGAGAGAGAGRARAPAAALDDAFQLYEIARFLEMPIVVQGCEDAIAEALSADTLPHVLRWACAPHASRWVHRQAMRYFLDEFPMVMASPSAARLPRPALALALASPFLQASEPQALRALLRWAERAAASAQPGKQHAPKPNVVWHTAHSVSRRTRRRSVSDAALRELLAALIPLVRTEHVPPDHELLQQMVRRGLMAAPAPAEGGGAGGAADAWLGRGACRPARIFLPHLDELKALLECQAPPEAELARMRRARYMHRIPDTLYMVAAARGGAAAARPEPARACEGACVSPRALAAMRARVRELRAAAPAARALALHAHDTNTVLTQIALRTVREMSLPDSCADLLLNDDAMDREREWESPSERRRWEHESTPPDCCRRAGSAGSARGGRPAPDARHSLDNSRSNTCRRDPSRSADSSQHRQMVSTCAGRALRGEGPRGEGPRGEGPAGGARLSARVPDVAMAPNANTHLLTALAAPPAGALQHASEYSTGGILQLDLGDGATHTPRPGSRAARAVAAQQARAREPAPAQVAACARADEAELRAALELSVLRAYSSFHPRGAEPAAPLLHARCLATTLPHPYRGDLQQRIHNFPRASPSPSALSSNSGHLALPRPLSRVGSVGGASSISGAGGPAGGGPGGGGGGPGSGGPGGAYSSNSSSASASPTPHRHKRTTKPRDYRLEPPYGSRGHSPSNIA